MEAAEALKIVRALADGINPSTEERFGRETIFQEPETIRALEKAATLLEVEAKRAARNRNRAQATKRWLRSEEERLCLEFESGMSVREIAERHGRTDGGILVRLGRLGKISLLPAPDSFPSLRRKPPSSASSDRPWLPQEDEQLCSEFHGLLEVEEIAGHLGRSKQAVVSRLTVLRKIELKTPLRVVS